VALSIGELVAYLRTDDSRLGQGLAAARGRLAGFGDAAKAGLAVAGAAAGAALGAGIAANLDIGAGRAKLAAQLDLSAEDSARIGGVAGKVYANNFGGSLDEINETIKAVGNNLGNVTRMSSADLQKMSESALALSDVFGVDVNESTKAAGQMIKNGLAKNSIEAFDIITKGFQLGLDKSGDFMDTLNEYSPQFSKLGIDGAHALTILSAGLQAGARDTDTIADAFKEFSLRSIDGSKTTADGFKAIGLNAKDTAAQIAKGGPAAQSATMTTLQALNKIKDPIKQNAAGVALFGTQWEDTLRGILPSIAGAEEGMEGMAGSTQRMADAAGTSGKAKIDTMKRSVEQWIQAQTSSSSALGTTTAALVSFAGPGFAMAGTLGQIVTALAAVNIQTAATAVWTGISSAATKVWAGVQWLLNAAMSANPIGIIIVLIIALVAGLIYAWKHSETFRTVVLAAWGAIKTAGLAVFGWLGGFISGTWNMIKSVTSAVWGFISGYIRMQINIMLGIVRGIIAVVTFFRDAFNRANSAVVGAVVGLINYVRGIGGRVVGAIGNLGSLMYDKGREIIQGIINGIKAMAGALAGAARDVIGSISGFLPGSPVKVGPLRVLNSGRAGKAIVSMVSDGMDSAAPRLKAAMAGALSGIPAPRTGGIGMGGGAPSQQSVAVVQFRGDREVMSFIRSIVRNYGGGSVQVAFGS
jgi:phage-related minor tail protein